MPNNNLAKERIGLKRKNRFGSEMEIVKYNKSIDILVKFETGNLVKVTWQEFKSGYVKNPYDKTIYEHGYLGEGKYKAYINSELQYRTWCGVLERCYCEKRKEIFPTYKDCTLYDDWHNFQNFAAWNDQNYYEINGEKMNLDKDILVKGNKVYSPETCIFVPSRINTLFINRKLDRGNFPIGVFKVKSTGKFRMQLNLKDKRISKGDYNTPEEAFLVYKSLKENYIKEVAGEYKDKIPEKLYSAMTKYIIEITD
jgi:hypothetical protein